MREKEREREKMKLQGVFLVAIFFSLAYTQLVKGQSWPGCKTNCGNVTIDYPFGTSPGCYYAEDRSFNLTCNKRDELIFGGNKVIEVSHSGELRVLVDISYACYNSQGILGDHDNYSYRLGNLSLSAKNKFTLVGCNAFGLFSTSGKRNQSTGCMSFCNSLPAADGECNGDGCCQTSVQEGNNYFEVTPYSLTNHTDVHKFNPCTYAFLVEDGKFIFNSSEDLRNLRNVKSFPVVLDWSIGKQTCKQVGNTSICCGNSTCFNSERGTGYNCKCKEGYEGNPYLSNSCRGTSSCFPFLLSVYCFPHAFLVASCVLSSWARHR